MAVIIVICNLILTIFGFFLFRKGCVLKRAGAGEQGDAELYEVKWGGKGKNPGSHGWLRADWKVQGSKEKTKDDG